MNHICLQLFAGNDADEFSSILNRQNNPKILITTCRFNSTVCNLNSVVYVLKLKRVKYI